QNRWGLDILKLEGPVQALNSEVACDPFGTLAKRLDLFGTEFAAKIACEKLFILRRHIKAAGILHETNWVPKEQDPCHPEERSH
ncbi:MAG: hypothetical protein GTN46_09660, partial [Gammaproteobacteria bacterium]|nr:hypothetical protein [Gammaproteobacteria bacterium]NIT41735.1 hypothetical protein [Gammaproteobacteria bacterium]